MSTRRHVCRVKLTTWTRSILKLSVASQGTTLIINYCSPVIFWRYESLRKALVEDAITQFLSIQSMRRTYYDQNLENNRLFCPMQEAGSVAVIQQKRIYALGDFYWTVFCCYCCYFYMCCIVCRFIKTLRGCSIDDLICEPDTSPIYSHARSNKIYDLAGFICGRLKPAISAWTEDFLQLNFYPSHLCARAVHDGLSADFLVARDCINNLTFYY